MNELHRAADELFTEIDHLDNVLKNDDPDLMEIQLALSIAKRGRRRLNLLLRALAERRDTLQPD